MWVELVAGEFYCQKGVISQVDFGVQGRRREKIGGGVISDRANIIPLQGL